MGMSNHQAILGAIGIGMSTSSLNCATNNCGSFALELCYCHLFRLRGVSGACDAISLRGDLREQPQSARESHHVHLSFSISSAAEHNSLICAYLFAKTASGVATAKLDQPVETLTNVDHPRVLFVNVRHPAGKSAP